MSSIKDRQRAAARARLEKEMAERAASARKRRQRQAVLGSAIALVLVVAGSVWLVSYLSDDDEEGTNTAAPSASSAAPAPPGTANCEWKPEPSGGQNTNTLNVGTPPPNVPAKGVQTLTIDTNLGAIAASMDLSKVPCTAASFSFLASKKFWDGSKCHRMLTEGIFVLQCGDPTTKGKGFKETAGTGGPSYAYAEENLPTGQAKPYPAGTLAMAKNQAPGTTGSQFFLVYKDTMLDPAYTVVGKLTQGLNIVQDVAKAGHDNALAEQGGGGHPKKEVVIKTIKVTDN